MDIESGRRDHFYILWGVANFSKIIKYSNINDIYYKYSNILILKHVNECNEYSDI